MKFKMAKSNNLQKAYDDKVKQIYLVRMNIGGLLHSKVYVCKRHSVDYGYCDSSGNYGFSYDQLNRAVIGKNASDGCWSFVFLDKKDAEKFLVGAKEILAFMQQTWLYQYGQKEDRQIRR